MGQWPAITECIADQTVKDKTTVTRLIDGMVRKELVIRHENPNDRRRSDIILTSLGTSLKSKLVPIAMEPIFQAVKNVAPEDIETTLKTLRAFAENLTQSNENTN